MEQREEETPAPNVLLKNLLSFLTLTKTKMSWFSSDISPLVAQTLPRCWIWDKEQIKAVHLGGCWKEPLPRLDCKCASTLPGVAVLCPAAEGKELWTAAGLPAWFSLVFEAHRPLWALFIHTAKLTCSKWNATSHYSVKNCWALKSRKGTSFGREIRQSHVPTMCLNKGRGCRTKGFYGSHHISFKGENNVRSTITWPVLWPHSCTHSTVTFLQLYLSWCYEFYSWISEFIKKKQPQQWKFKTIINPVDQ